MAEKRNSFYNENMALYEGNNLMFGSSPPWYSEKSCKEIEVTTNVDFDVTKVITDKVDPFCTADDFRISSSSKARSSSSSKIQSSSSSVMSSSSMSSGNFVTRSSSSSFSVFRDLVIRFKDVSGKGKNVERDFVFDVINKGNATANIGGYTARFYYKDVFVPAGVSLNFYGYNSNGTFSREQCDEHLFVADYKFSSNTEVKPTESVGNAGGSIMLDNYGYLDVGLFDNWSESSEFVEYPRMALFDASGSLVYGQPAWPCDGYKKKQLKLVVMGTATSVDLNNVQNAAADIHLQIENRGDSVVAGPVYVDFQVTHPAGHVPMLIVGGDTLSVSGRSQPVDSGRFVTRASAGDKHTFRFTLPNGFGGGGSSHIHFKLADQCIFNCTGDVSQYKWTLGDDWSAQGIVTTNAVVTEQVTIYSSLHELLYGKAERSAPVLSLERLDDGAVTQPAADIELQNANRTDAVAYSGGQLLSGGDFESPWLQGWTVENSDSLRTARSVRGRSPQGSRYLSVDAGVKISQTLDDATAALLADSGAVLTVWHNGGPGEVLLNGNLVRTFGATSWKVDTISIGASLFNRQGGNKLSIVADPSYGLFEIDDAVLVPGSKVQPVTYATRFTNTAGEELETRAYDGASEQIVTTSERDSMGRLWKKYLPFAMNCHGVVDCNSDLRTLHNPGIAKQYYTVANPDYPDAGGVPYVETLWKPDPEATKDVESAPGKAFGVDSAHLVRAFSSGVNLSGVNLLDSASLDSAVSAVSGWRAYGSTFYHDWKRDRVGNAVNYHAAKDDDPTHLWELNVDRDGRKAFTVKDGEGHVIVSGSLDANGRLLAWSVNELDERGNVIKSHPPLSCEYSPKPANCVNPSTYGYDAQSRLVWSKEPDAGETRTYYDLAGRVRATQTQRQIDSG